MIVMTSLQLLSLGIADINTPLSTGARSALKPRPMKLGTYMLQERVLNDPEHASKRPILATFPTRAVDWSEVDQQEVEGLPQAQTGTIQEYDIVGEPTTATVSAGGGAI